MTRIAILASGSGSNAEAIIKAFEKSAAIKLSLVISNNKDAGVLERAQKYSVPTCVINSKQSKEGALLKTLNDYSIDFVVLAGYMKLIPSNIIEAYPNKIVNIHPALLPKYGGKGMYGMHVHEAVVENNETETGITIHYVNEHYDEGTIIFQATCDVNSNDSAEDVAAKIHELEMEHFPKVVERLLNQSIL